LILNPVTRQQSKSIKKSDCQLSKACKLSHSEHSFMLLLHINTLSEKTHKTKKYFPTDFRLRTRAVAIQVGIGRMRACVYNLLFTPSMIQFLPQALQTMTKTTSANQTKTSSGYGFAANTKNIG
jgi:hypothetical protein